MTEIVCKYHNNLQRRNPSDYDNPRRRAAQTKVLHQILEAQKFNSPDADINHLITQDQISMALHSSKNSTATGLDGLPYELWKLLCDQHN